MWIQFERNDRSKDRISFVIIPFLCLVFSREFSSAEFLRIEPILLNVNESIPVESSKFTEMDGMEKSKKKQQQQRERIE